MGEREKKDEILIPTLIFDSLESGKKGGFEFDLFLRRSKIQKVF